MHGQRCRSEGHEAGGRRLVRCSLLAGLVLLTGCAGYQVGNWSLYPQHIETVHVPIFESNSFRRNLGERLTEAVMKEIEAKTPYKVVDRPNADSVLSGRIVGESKRVLVEDRFDQPREVEVNLQVQVRWIDCRGEMLYEGVPIAVPPELNLVGASASLIPEVGQSIVTAW